MAKDRSHVQTEHDVYRANLKNWIHQVNEMVILESRKGVRDRFVRDCNNLLSDFTKNKTPTTADMNDFTDRHNSIEIQFNIFTSGNQKTPDE